MKQIVLKSLQIENFKKIESLNIDFDGIQLITGKNGSGKSSIFEAIYVALYNRRLNGQPAKSAIKVGTSSSYLKLIFYVNNSEYILERQIGNSKSNVKLTIDGVEYSKSANTIKQMIDDLIPNYVIKLNMLEDIDIRDILTKLVDVDKYLNAIKQVKKEIQDELNQVEIEKQKLEVQIQTLESNIIPMETQINELKEKVKKLTEEITYYDNMLSKYDKTIVDKIRQIASTFEMYFNNYKSSLISEIDNNIADITNVLNDYKNQYKALYKELEIVESQYSHEINKVKTWYDIAKHNNEYSDNINTYKNELSKIESLLNDIGLKIDKYKHAMQDKNICPTCLRELDVESRQEVERKLQELQVEYDKLLKQKDELNNKVVLLEDEYKQYLDKIEETYKSEIEKIKSEYESKITSIKDKLQVLQEYINKYEEKLHKFDTKKQEVLNQIDKSKVYYQYLEENGIDMQTYLNYYEITFSPDKNIDVIQSKLVELKANKQSIENNIKIYIDRVQKDKQQLATLKNQLDKVNEKYNVLFTKYDIANKLDNSRVWKKTIMSYLKDIINNYISTIENKLLDITLDLDDKDNIIIKVTNLNGEEVTFNDISQGEKVIAKLMLYDAIRHIAQTEVKFNSMFLDEVIDRLDPDNVQLVLQYLKSIADEGSNILVITHNTYAKDVDIFDSVIEMS